MPLDLIIGFNKDEGLEAILDLLMDPNNDTNFAKVRESWEVEGPYRLFDQHPSEVTGEVVELAHRVAEFYLGEEGIASYDQHHLQAIVNMYSDAWYWYTMHEWTSLAATDNLTIFRYIFSHNTALGLVALSGVAHPEQYGGRPLSPWSRSVPW